MSLSPDGSVLATAGKDGHLKFWQVYLEGGDQEEAKYVPLRGLGNNVMQDPGLILGKA